MSAILYMMRHGRSQDGERMDGSRRRPKFLARAKEHPKVVMCSPFRRARDTGDFMQSALGISGRLVITSNLRPDGDAADAVTEIVKYTDAGYDTLVITHQPLLDAVLARIMGVKYDPGMIQFKHGSIMRLDVDSKGDHDPKKMNRLRWFITPKIAKRVM